MSDKKEEVLSADWKPETKYSYVKTIPITEEKPYKRFQLDFYVYREGVVSSTQSYWFIEYFQLFCKATAVKNN